MHCLIAGWQAWRGAHGKEAVFAADFQHTGIAPSTGDLNTASFMDHVNPGADSPVEMQNEADAGDITIRKARLRELLRNKRGQLPAEARSAKSRKAQRHLLASDVWRKCACPGLYMPVAGETGTGLLYASARESKIPLFPRVRNVRAGTMEFFPCPVPAWMRPGAFGIPEPPAGAAATPDLLVLPGLAFAANGQRLGYGGGFYDRYLAGLGDSGPLLVGLCYEFQVMDSLPQAGHDMSVDAICTEVALTWL